jgi:hypothetical protein
MAATNDHADVGNADLWPALRYDDSQLRLIVTL